MNKLPRVLINLTKIVHNYRKINERCLKKGITLTGVIKGVAGDGRVINSLIDAGLIEIGDSRLENLVKIEAGRGVRKMLLRLPSQSRIDETVKYSDISLNSEITTIEKLEQSAGKHQVLLMADLGDRREGVLEDQLSELAGFCSNLKNVQVIGLGANFSCFAGVMPTVAKLKKLAALGDFLKTEFGLPIQYISGGNSSSLPLLYSEELPSGVNHLRIGEGILLGRETLNGDPLPDLFQDAFTMEAEIIQSQWKPSTPEGEQRFDAFGRKPDLPVLDAGIRLLLNIGQQDTPLAGLTPFDPGLTVMGGSSDYLVLAAAKSVPVGQVIQFLPNYWSLLALMTSPYVEKVYL
jgi:predicted amino acid racemase